MNHGGMYQVVDLPSPPESFCATKNSAGVENGSLPEIHKALDTADGL